MDEYGQHYIPRSEEQYPPPTSSDFTFNTEFVPDALKELLDEMLYALAGGKLRLATLALRMTIEFIVNDANCKGSNLQQKIDDLKERDLIGEIQKDLLHKIRLKGNRSAHAARPMGRAEMVAGMGIVDLLLEAFYSGPARKQRLISLAQGAFADDGERNIQFIEFS